jgi:hypothetical protein
MKWIIFLLLVAAGVWAYFNVDFTNVGSQTNSTIKQEKTLKKFFDADQQNKDETKDVLNNY